MENSTEFPTFQHDKQTTTVILYLYRSVNSLQD